MKLGPTDVSCRDRCWVNCFRKFIDDGLPRGSSGYDSVFVLRWVAINGAGKSIHLAGVCGFAELEVITESEAGDCPPL